MAVLDERVAALLADGPAPDQAARAAVQQRASRALRPSGALARLDEVAGWLAAWQRTTSPEVRSPSAVVFAADHGVAVEEVSAYPAAVTAAMLEALRSGVATAAVMARQVGAHLEVVDVGVGVPTGNITVEPALGRERFSRCFEAGRRAVAGLDTDLLVLGEMGIANTTAASAVSTALFGPPADAWTGRGTGLDEEARARKIAVVETAVRRLQPDTAPLEILRQVGGAELAAIAGGVVEARRRSIPVLLDGFVVTAAVAPLEVLRPGALDHCLAGHRSSEPGHELLLSKLGKQPLLDLDLRLGEGTGALAAVPLVRLAAASVTEVATFEEWGLAGP
jgi:nicotinate-nucleotide--dimethylbenzimidazole phosphoribosyltransferase